MNTADIVSALHCDCLLTQRFPFRIRSEMSSHPRRLPFWASSFRYHITVQGGSDERIGGVVVPVASSKAHIRLFGAATFRMTYSYAEINGQPVD